jgi:hypothetical protein
VPPTPSPVAFGDPWPKAGGQAVPDQVHDAGLHDGLWKHRGYRFGEAFEAVNNGDEDIVDPARLEVVDNLEPNFAPSVCSIQSPRTVLLAVRIEGKRHIDSLVLDQAFVANLDPQGVEEHNGIDRVERPVLPVPHLLEHRVGDPADDVGRYLRPVELSQMGLDLAHRHATRIEAQDFIIEAVETGLALGN